MRAPPRGAAAVSAGLTLAVCAAISWAHGVVAAIAVGSTLVAGILAFLLVEARRSSARLERELGLEAARARQISDHAWQSALLRQVVDELAVAPDETSMLEMATATLVRTLEASRAVVYGRDHDGTFRVRAQAVADGVTPLDADSELPAVLAFDRELAERFSTNEVSEDAEPELRALAARLQVRSALVVPLTEESRLAVQQCDEARVWTSTEHRFVEGFADRLASVLRRSAENCRLSRDAEVRAGLVRVGHALLGVREPRDVLDIATSVGAPLARSRASAVLLDRGGDGFQVAAQQGLPAELSASGVDALESDLEDCLRTRSTIRLEPRDLHARCAHVRSLGTLRSFGPMALVPLYYGREALGVFLFEKAPGDGHWTGADVEVAETLGALTASALKNARLFESLAAAQARYADGYDNAPDLYQTIASTGRILDCNLTECLTLGYTKADLVGRAFDGVVVRGSAARWRSVKAELFARGYVRDANLKLRARDGRSVDVLVNASVVPATDEAPLSARVVMRDVTVQRQLEEKLRQRQKLEIVGTLAGGIAHDFNNVLGGILGYASLLQAHLHDRPTARRFVDTIERSALRGAALTGRLLAASRKTPERRHAVDINDVVDDTLELLAHTFHKRVRIDKQLDPRVRPILADAGQLQQIVLNLCVNARDAMPAGGSLRVVTEIDGERRLRLSVEDTGVGIEPATMERLFEPFFSTKGEGGSGLGLSVVYGIVKSLGGEVRVKSSPGSGARFDILLPADWIEGRDQSATHAAPVRGRGELVLLVDDEHVLRELGKEILESHGYRVRAVASGEDALSFIRESGESVSLVILDLVMPGLDGGETYRRLRDVNRRVPVLLSSGLSSEDAVEEILADGATGFIPKPYGIGELTQAVSLAIRKDAHLMH